MSILSEKHFINNEKVKGNKPPLRYSLLTIRKSFANSFELERPRILEVSPPLVEVGDLCRMVKLWLEKNSKDRLYL